MSPALHHGIVGAVSMVIMFGFYYGGKAIIHLIKNPDAFKRFFSNHKIKAPQLPKGSKDAQPIQEHQDAVGYGGYSYTTTYSNTGAQPAKRVCVRSPKMKLTSIIGYILGSLLLVGVVLYVSAVNRRESDYLEATKYIGPLGPAYQDKPLLGNVCVSYRMNEYAISWANRVEYRKYYYSQDLHNAIREQISNNNNRIYRAPYVPSKYYSDLRGRPYGVDANNEYEKIDISKHPLLLGKGVFAIKNSRTVQAPLGRVDKPHYLFYIIDQEEGFIHRLDAVGIDDCWADYLMAHLLYDYPLNNSFYVRKMSDKTCTTIICICSALFVLMTILIFRKRKE